MIKARRSGEEVEAFDVTNAEGEVDADLPSTDIKSSEDALDDRIGEQEISSHRKIILKQKRMKSTTFTIIGGQQCSGKR